MGGKQCYRQQRGLRILGAWWRESSAKCAPCQSRSLRYVNPCSCILPTQEVVVEIGRNSFGWCDHSITTINIPTSLRRIRYAAFSHSLRTPIRLHDGIESIGASAFAVCIFTNFRVPPLITVIPDAMLGGCKSTFSLELPENVMEIESGAFAYCYCLRNVAFPPNAVFDDNIFIDEDDNKMTDLQRLFGSNTRII